MNSPRHKRSSTRDPQDRHHLDLSLSGSTVLDPAPAPPFPPVSQAYLSAMAALQSQVARLESERQKLADHLLTVEGEAVQVRQFWEDKVRQLAEARQTETKAAKLREDTLKRDVEERELKIRELVSAIEGLEGRTTQEIEKLKRNLELEAQKKKEAALRFDNEERKASMLKVEVEECRQQISNLRVENQDLMTLKCQSASQLDRLQSQLEKANLSLQQSSESSSKLKQELSETRSKLSGATTQNKALQDRLDISEQELSIKSRHLLESEEQIARLKEQLSYMESTVVPAWERKYTALKEKERQAAQDARQTTAELREQLSCSLKTAAQKQATTKEFKTLLKQSLACDEELLMSLDTQS